MSDPAKILVRAPNWTGDVIMATPGFRALRARFPAAQITAHVRPGLEPLLDAAPWFDAVLPVRSYHRGVAALLREAAELRRERFDLGLCLPDSFSSALLMRAGGVGRVVGYRRGGRSLLLHRSVEPLVGAKPGWVARERHVLGLTGAVGCEDQRTELELFVSDAESREAGSALGAAAAGPLALLAPGASYGPSKLWPAERFAAVGDSLAAVGASVAVLGTPAEAALTARVVHAMTAPALDLGGALSLGGLKGVVSQSRVLVCNDAGARHVAVALGVPCVVMMGSTALEKTDCNLEHVMVVSADVSCRPCYQRTCPIDHRCMTRIDAERVAEEAIRALQADGAAHFDGGTLLLRGDRDVHGEAA